MRSPITSSAPARGVIFDMDGLLVDSEPFWRRVEGAVFDDYGVDIRAFLGHGLTMGLRVDDAVAFLAQSAGLVLEDVEPVVERVVKGVVDAINAEAVLLPGALEAIDYFDARGLKIALASGSVPPVIDAVLDRFALRPYFELVSSAADDRYGKPHPAIFLRTAEGLGVEPTSCVVLEDSLNGVIAAKAARMRAIAVPHANDASDPRFRLADVQLESLLEIDDERVELLLGTETIPAP